MRKSLINITSGALGYLIPMVLNLIFTPVIVKNLGSEAFGLQSLVNVIIGFLMVADMGLDIPVTKFVAEYKNEAGPGRLNELLNTSLQLYVLIGLIGAGLISCSAPFLIDTIFKIPIHLKAQALDVFYLAGFGFLGGLLSMWGKSIFNGLLRYDISNGINIISNLISLLLGVILVLNGFGVVAYVMSRVFCVFLTGLAYFLISKGLLLDFKFKWGISAVIWQSLKTQIGYGFFLRLSGIITSRIDQTFIGIWIGLAAVGYYSIPILITTSIAGLINSMVHYIFPSMSELTSKGKVIEVERLFMKGSRLVSFLAFFIITPCIVFSEKFLMIWIGSDIAENASYVFILLLLGTLIQLIFVAVLNFYIVGIGRLNLFTTYTLIRGIVMGLACAVLVARIGLEGAGWAMLAAAGVDIGFFIFVIFRFLKPYILTLLSALFAKLLAISIISGIIIKFTILESVNNWFFLIVGGVLFTFLFLALCALLKVWDEGDKVLFQVLKNKLIQLSLNL